MVKHTHTIRRQQLTANKDLSYMGDVHADFRIKKKKLLQHRPHSSVLIVNFEQVLHNISSFLLFSVKVFVGWAVQILRKHIWKF